MKDLAQFYRVLADETRLHILCLLHQQQELCVCDIMGALGITQSKASRHLAALRHAGLVADRKDGSWSYYSLCPADGRTAADMVDLRARLASHPAAALIQGQLQAWLERKDRGAACGADQPGGEATASGGVNGISLPQNGGLE